MEKTLTKPTRNRWWITNFAVPIAVAVAVAVMMLSGCVNGPARCYLNGRFNYLTVETAKNAPWYTYPVTLPAAVIGDAGILVADTVAVPVMCLSVVTFVHLAGPVAVFALPLLYPFFCVIVPFNCKDSVKGGVLYQRLYGYHYFKTPFGKVKIIPVEKTAKTSQTVLELNGETVGAFLGKLVYLACNADNVVVTRNDNTVVWWQRVNGEWKQRPWQLVPENSELCDAIDREIKKLEKLKGETATWADNWIAQKEKKVLEKKIAIWEGVKPCLENSQPPAVEILGQPDFWEKGANNVSGQDDKKKWYFSYVLRLDYGADVDFTAYVRYYVDDEECDISVDRYFSSTELEISDE
ncbi:MAG: hypothetical protein IKO65_02795 [Victivallales bacterium]|nr:hypothetical protein [Victivallales bacterium]